MLGTQLQLPTSMPIPPEEMEALGLQWTLSGKTQERLEAIEAFLLSSQAGAARIVLR